MSPRDGLQNLPAPAVPTEVKRELVERLLAAGVRNVEVGSFVRGDRVPQVRHFYGGCWSTDLWDGQMADTSVLLPQLPDPSTVAANFSERPARSESPFSGLTTVANPSSSVPNGDEMVHYPVLVPNMRGLQNLLRLEEQRRSQGGKHRLTDEIAVFVSATEVSVSMDGWN